MQTFFQPRQLADPDTRHSETILRSCVHCGFCTATCPTYVLLGDELDSPRGRIYLIKNMLEGGEAPSEKVVRHIDRCLSCLACMTTCPSGVNYMHLVDHARRYIAESYRRPLADRLLRRLLGWLLPRPAAFRMALIAARFGRPFRRLLPGRLAAMLDLAPARLPGPSPIDRPQVFAATAPRRLRVALLTGCAQQVLAPEINEATIRLLTRHGVEVVVASGAGCCGAINHHLGQHEAALQAVRANVDAWTALLEAGGLDAIVVNASGCGTTLKDYGHLLRQAPAYAAKAERIAGLACDISELLARLELKPGVPTGLTVAYHAACSLQHGQKVTVQPVALLRAAGFRVLEVPEGHLCCGSAGTYNLLQPEIAGRLRRRKLDNIERLRPDVIAAGNIGCMAQLASGTAIPVAHTVELIDWATGGAKPPSLAARR